MLLDINTKASRRDMFKLTNENASLQKESTKIINYLLFMCSHISHKADFRDSTGNKKKYIQ